jgi:hypothetical protein
MFFGSDARGPAPNPVTLKSAAFTPAQSRLEPDFSKIEEARHNESSEVICHHAVGARACYGF